MEAILAKLLLPDNEVIKQATEELRVAFKQSAVIPELCGILASSSSPQIRQYAAILLRKKFSKGKIWKKFRPEDRSLLKAGCLQSLQQEKEKSVSGAITQLVAILAKHELSAGGWPELLQFLQSKVTSSVREERVLAVTTLSVLAEMAGEQMKPFLKDFLVLFRKTLEDPEEDVCFYSIVALTHFVRRTSSDVANQFQLLVPTILQKIQLLVKSNQDKATVAIDIFDELIECEVPIVVPHIKPIVELCMALAGEASLEDPLRKKAVTFLGRLTRLKKKTIVKHKLYRPMITVIFNVMAQHEVEDDDEDAEEEDDSPALAASQSLDILALNLPPEKYMAALLAQVQPAMESANPLHQRAAYQAIAVSAEGCQEYIRTKYLPHFLQMMGQGIRHAHHLVRNAALYMLGQFSEFIQPELSEHAGDILPVLLQYLDSAFAQLNPGAKDSVSLSRIFYALDSFCENLEEKLVPHLPDLMPRALASLNPSFSVRVRELGISLIGSAANAVKHEIIPYFDTVYGPLQAYLTAQHTEETQVLLTTSMSTLGVLARCVGKEKFSREFAEECVKIGMQLVQTNDDPDIRKCAYALFGSVATIVKEDMGAVMEPVVTLMLKTLQSTEGISLEVDGASDSNLPLEQLEDEEEEISLEDDTENALDDLEEVKGISVENAFVAEKECAITALKDLSVECGPAFYPYIYQSMEEVWNLLDYPDDDVKAAAIEAISFFLIAYFKSGIADGMEAFKKGVVSFVPRLCDMVIQDPEHQIVVASLDALTELLKQCKTGITDISAHPQLIAGCVTKIMKKECACQDQEEEEGGMEEDEEAEQDEMLFEYAGEVLPNLGRAMTPHTFAPYFAGLFQMLVKKTKKQCSVAERSFAVGALADCMEPLQGQLDRYLKDLLHIFLEKFRDSENDVRNNAVYGVGEVVLWGGPVVAPHYPQILSALSGLVEHEPAPRVIDQIVGAVSRFIVVAVASIPLTSLLPVMMAQLPLKEDMDEYELVFKAFNTLLNSCPEVFKPCLAKVVECCLAYLSSREKDSDREKIKPLAVTLLKQSSNTFSQDFQALLSALPAETAASLVSVLA